MVCPQNGAMSESLKVGLCGAGVFAGYHAQKVVGHPRSDLIGVFDHNPERMQALADHHEVPAFGDWERLVAASDALVIASPASSHADYAIPAIAAGRHCLVEKPLATSADEAVALAEASRAAGTILQVGHQERVVAEAIGLPDLPARPRTIHIARHTGRTTRNLDTSVVMDLMIHDIDLLLSLYGPPDWVSTEQARAVYSGHLDVARAEMGWGAMTAYLSASRDDDPARRWTLRFDGGTADIDFADQTLRHDTGFDLDAGFGDRPEVKDSLAAAYARFVGACLDGSPPLASGDAGAAAVRVAEQIGVSS